jgi:hypothetical protein
MLLASAPCTLKKSELMLRKYILVARVGAAAQGQNFRREERMMKYQGWDTENNIGSFSAAFFIGTATGLIAGLLLTPKAGKESRGMVKAQFGSVRDKVMRRGKANGGELQEEPLESAVRADYLH